MVEEKIESVNLEDLFHISSSKRVFREEYSETGIPFYRSKEIIELSKGKEISDPYYISETKYKDLERYGYVEPGDILMTAVGSLGIPYRAQSKHLPFYFKDGNLIWMKSKDSRIDLSFVEQYFRSVYFKNSLLRIVGGSSQKALTMVKLSKVEIPIPPLPEQKKIADILSTVDEAIQNTKAQIEKTKELKLGLMQKLFSEGIGHTEFKDSKLGRIPEEWEVVRMGELASKVGSGVTPKGGSSSYLEIGIPMIRSQNVVNGPIKWNNMAYISQEQHDKMERSKLQPKDVLLNISGASIGRTAMVPDDMIDANVNQHVCIIRPIKKLNANYLKEFLTSNYGQEQIYRLQAGGNREGLNYEQIRDFLIPVPSVDEQRLISSIIDESSNKINVLKSELYGSMELKKGLMQKLLTGEVRVKI